MLIQMVIPKNPSGFPLLENQGVLSRASIQWSALLVLPGDGWGRAIPLRISWRMEAPEDSLLTFTRI